MQYYVMYIGVGERDGDYGNSCGEVKNKIQATSIDE